MILLVGLLASAYVANLVRTGTDATIHRQLQIDSRDATLKIQAYLQSQEQVLLGLAALFETSTSVDRDEFHAYVKRVQVDKGFKAVLGLGFSQLLFHAQLSKHIAYIQKQGFPEYNVVPQGIRDAYSPVVYIAPFTSENRRTFGYDPYSDPTRRAAMDKSRDTNQTTLSSMVQLVQETGETPQSGALMYQPVYRNLARVDTIENRRAALVGWVYSPIRVHDLIQEILQEWITGGDKKINIKIYDGPAMQPVNLLYQSHPDGGHASSDANQFHLKSQVNFNGQLWTLYFERTANPSPFKNYLTAWVTLGAGILISMLVSMLLLLYLKTLRFAGRVADRLSNAVKENEALEVLRDAIFGSANFSCIATDTKGVIQLFNVGAEQMLGYEAADVVDKISVTDLSDYQEMISRAAELSIEQDTLINPGFEALVFKADRCKEDIYELTYTRKNGSRFPAIVSVSGLRNRKNEIVGYLVIGTDNTAQKAAEESLAREIKKSVDAEQIENDWFRLQSAALQVCANAILIADAKGIVLWANPASSELSGYGSAEMIGHPFKQLVTSDVLSQGLESRLKETLHSGLSWKGELINHRKNGDLLNEHITITPVTNSQGSLTHYIVVKQDITRLKQAEVAANDANQAKSRFLANMSHELRTPMNGIVGMVEILQKTQLEPSQLHMLRTIETSALNLMQILNNILDFSKIEEGKINLERIPTHLRVLAEDIANLLAATPSLHAFDLLLYVSPSLPRWTILDSFRLRQVLLNLVGNAIKFSNQKISETSRIILSIESSFLENGAPGVLFSVQDNGIGMSPEAHSQLFQPFHQADESTSRLFGGTGLGLSICQRLVGLMHGEIAVQTTLGEGSEFRFILPLEEGMPPSMPVFDPSLIGVHVLVLIHEKTLEKTVASYCQAVGSEVTLLEDLTAVRRHVKNFQSQSIRVVIVVQEHFDVTQFRTDLPDDVGIVWLGRLGCNMDIHTSVVDAYPLLFSDLIRAVALVCGLLTLQPFPLIDRQGAISPSCALKIECAPTSQPLILVAEDNEINRTVIQLQLQLLGYRCDLAEDGVQALNMLRNGFYALLMTDCRMPHMDGFELTASIRRSELPGTHLPIVAITANAMRGEVERCHAAGMDDYITKPMRTEDLAPLLKKWLP